METIDSLIINETWEDAQPPALRRHLTIGQIVTVLVIVVTGVLAMLVALVLRPHATVAYLRNTRSHDE